MPGIFVQTVCFGAVSTAIGLADDLQKGLIERFRALPMSRTAVLAGPHASSDVFRNVFVIIVMTVVGIAVGFRPTRASRTTCSRASSCCSFAFGLSWGFAYVGLAAPNTETAQVMAFPILFPLTFASSCFVNPARMPSWLQGFATYQPVSQVASAARGLMIGWPTHPPAPGALGDGDQPRDHRDHGAGVDPQVPPRPLVHRSAGRGVAHVAKAMGVSRQCAHRWVKRFDEEGVGWP